MTKIPSGKSLNVVNFGKSTIPGDQAKNLAQPAAQESADVQKDAEDLLRKDPGVIGKSLAFKGKIDPKSYANIANSVSFAGKHLKELQATEKFFETEDYPTAIMMQEAAVEEFKK